MSGIRENHENPNISNIANIALFADILQIVKIGLMLTIYPFPIYDRILSLAGNPVPCVGVANAPSLKDRHIFKGGASSLLTTSAKLASLSMFSTPTTEMKDALS